MEYISDDSIVLQLQDKSTLISKGRVEKIYDMETEKIRKLGIIIYDSNYTHNVLWSESRAKLYFIDFSLWDLSNVKNTKRRSLLSRIFGW
jgi:hypothetical protein